MNWVIIYLIIGLLITALLDHISQKNEDPEQHLTNTERVVIILIWPLTFWSFIINFLKNLK